MFKIFLGAILCHFFELQNVQPLDCNPFPCDLIMWESWGPCERKYLCDYMYFAKRRKRSTSCFEDCHEEFKDCENNCYPWPRRDEQCNCPFGYHGLGECCNKIGNGGITTIIIYTAV